MLQKVVGFERVNHYVLIIVVFNYSFFNIPESKHTKSLLWKCDKVFALLNEDSLDSMLPQLEALMLENRWPVNLHDNDIISILVD